MGQSYKSVLPSVLAIILAGGRGSRLYDLTDTQPKPALPVGSRGHLIDFTLANVVHSGITRSLVLTQYEPEPLLAHLEERWRALCEARDFSLGFIDGLSKGSFNGTADAVAKVATEIDHEAPSHVAILAGDHLYQMDYRPFVERHLQTGAQVTVGVVQVPVDEAHEFGVMTLDPEGRIADFAEKPANPVAMADRPGFALASMGIYVFEWALLRKLLLTSTLFEPDLDFGKHVLPRLVRLGTAYAYELPGRGQAAPLWRDLGTLDAYHAIHADLENDRVPLDPTWPVLVGTPRQPALRPVLFSSAPALSADGRGGWQGCSVGEGAQIGPHCTLKNVVILPGATVGEAVRIENAIITSDAIVPNGFDLEAALQLGGAWCTVSEGGIRVISARALAALAKLHPAHWRSWTLEPATAARSHAGTWRRPAGGAKNKAAERHKYMEDE